LGTSTQSSYVFKSYATVLQDFLRNLRDVSVLGEGIGREDLKEFEDYMWTMCDTYAEETPEEAHFAEDD